MKNPTNIQQQAMRLFREQAVSIAKSGPTVRIECDSCEEAELMFEWLTQLADQPDEESLTE